MTDKSLIEERDGVFCLTINYDGTNGFGWVKRLHAQGVAIPELLERFLKSGNFIPTKEGSSVIAIIRGCAFRDEDRTINKVHDRAKEADIVSTTIEESCLIREALNDACIKKMKLWYVVSTGQALACERENIHRFNFFGSGLSSDNPSNHNDPGMHMFDVKEMVWPKQTGFAFKIFT